MLLQRHTNRMKKIYILLLFLGLVSCVQDDSYYAPEIQDLKVAVQVKIDTPAETIPTVSTRSQTEDEAKIREIMILVFKNNQFQYISEGQITSSTVSSTVFTVSLNASSDALTLYLIANANDIVNSSGILVNDTKANAKEKLNMTFTNAGISYPFPMFGEYEASSISSNGNNNITGIKMLRSIARADVIVANSVTNFEFASIQLFRANSGIQIIPNAMTNTAVTSPSIPTSATANVGTTSLAVTGNRSEAQFYFPESEAPPESNQTSSATCIIIGGKYNGSSTTTYYRMDFDPGITGHPFGQILRNHKYVFNIQNVGVEGAGTPEDAANSQSSGVVVEVECWDENITDIYIGGNNYFGISSRSITLPFRKKSEDILSIETDASDVTLQWSDANGNPINSTSSSTIENTLFKATVSGDKTYITITAQTDNTSTQDIIQYMVIFAGSIKVQVKIIQLGNSYYVQTYAEILNIGLGEGTFSTAASGMRAILENTANFGVSGIVPVGGLSIDYCNAPSASTTKAAFRTQIERYNILYLTTGMSLNADLSTAIAEWLAYKSNRVLFIIKNSTGAYSNLCGLLGNNSMWDDISSSSLIFNFTGETTLNNYFTNSGPFGAVSNPNEAGFSLTGSSWSAAGINPSSTYAQNLIPLLNFTKTDNTKRYALAVDTDARIVYIGNPYIWQQGHGLNSSTGAIDSDAAKVMANLWAWAIEEVVISGQIYK